MSKKNTGSPRLIAAGAVLIALAAGWGIFRLSSREEPLSGATNEERTAFLRECGWDTELTHCDLTEVRIPVEFDEVYSDYNRIQQLQGFDLRPYRAHSVKKYTYLVTDPDDPRPDLYANLLVEEGVIIGADISAGEAGGIVTVLKPPED